MAAWRATKSGEISIESKVFSLLHKVFLAIDKKKDKTSKQQHISAMIHSILTKYDPQHQAAPHLHEKVSEPSPVLSHQPLTHQPVVSHSTPKSDSQPVVSQPQTKPQPSTTTTSPAKAQPQPQPQPQAQPTGQANPSQQQEAHQRVWSVDYPLTLFLNRF